MVAATLPDMSTIAKPQAGSERPPRFYRPELDAVRWFAFLAVFLHHGTGVSMPLVSAMGGFGLSLFFCLSAFLITELLQIEKERTGTIAMRAFYGRRMLRIWPLYFGFLLSMTVAGSVYPTLHVPGALLFAYSVLLGNWWIGRTGFTENPVGPLWSISVEEQFYLVWPALHRKFSRGFLALVAVALMVCGSIAAVFLLQLGATPALGLWTNTLVEFQMFGAGCLLALGLRGNVPRIHGAVRVVGLIAALACWAVAAKFCQLGHDLPGASPVRVISGLWLVAAGSVLLLVSVLGVRRECVPVWLTYLGKISYGLYVFHLLALRVAASVSLRVIGGVAASQLHHAAFSVLRLGIAITLTIASASLSYRYFEKPFMRWKERLAVVHSRVA